MSLLSLRSHLSRRVGLSILLAPLVMGLVRSADANDAQAPPDRRCRTFAEKNARTYKLLAGCKDCVEELRATFEECHVDARGAWGFGVDTASLASWSNGTEPPAVTSLAIGWSLVRRDDVDGGKPTVASASPFMTSDIASQGFNWADIRNGWDSVNLSTPIYFDYDGDGRDEVILRAHSATEGYSPAVYEIWTSSGGDVHPYPTPIRITGVEDVDHDGRPDLETIEVGADVVPGIGEARFSGPIIVYHSLPDGTFSGRDAVARADFEKQCPPALRTFSNAGEESAEGDEDLILPIVCARAAGMTPEAVRAVLDRRPKRDAAEFLFGTRDLSSAIDGTPSFRLTP